MARQQLGRNSFKGKLNKELTPLDIQNQDYVDALNAQFLSETQGQTLSIMPVIGNRLAFDLGSVSAHDKKYRVKFDLTATSTNYQVTGYRTDRNTPYLNNPVNFSNATDFSINFGIEVFSSGLNWTAVVDPSGEFVDFTITTDPYYEYFIESTGGDPIEIIVLEEAVDPSLIARKRIIGSNDLLGDLFVFSTTQTQLPAELSVVSVSAGAAGRVRITTIGNNLQTYQYVNIAGISTDPAVNGLWQISVISANSFDLIGSVFTVGFSGEGTITYNIYGLGEIGVATFDQQTDLWAYTPLLTSKEFGFNTQKQVECNSEINNIGKALYFHQVKYNPPRVFYYNQNTYIPNGGLEYNGGRYNYGSIANELITIQSSPVGKLTFVGQDQSGGALTAGNRIYAVRGLTSLDSLTKSPITSYTNPIPVYEENFNGNPNKILGSLVGTVTGKINRLQLTNIETSIYAFAELICIQNTGGAISAIVVERQPINGPVLNFEHTGLTDTASTDLSLDEIFQVFPNLKSVGSQTIIQNRLLYANIELMGDFDLSEWAQEITHRLEKETVSTNGKIGNAAAGGFQDPINCCFNMSLMLNETYRVGIEVDWITGGTSQVYWVDDIKVDTSATNITVPNRRTSTLPNYSLNDTLGADQCNVFRVYFDNIQMNKIVGGFRIRDLISGFRFVVVNLSSNPEFREILGSGPAIVGSSLYYVNQYDSGGFVFIGRSADSSLISSSPQKFIYSFEFPFATGASLVINGLTNDIDNLGKYENNSCETLPATWTNTFWFGNTKFLHVNRDYLSLYFPDLLFGSEDYKFRAGDKIINFGSMELYAPTNPLQSPYIGRTGPNLVYGQARDFFATNLNAYEVKDIEDSRFAGYGVDLPVPDFLFGEQRIFTKNLKFELNPTGAGPYLDEDMVVSHINEDTQYVKLVASRSVQQISSVSNNLGFYQVDLTAPITINVGDKVRASGSLLANAVEFVGSVTSVISPTSIVVDVAFNAGKTNVTNVYLAYDLGVADVNSNPREGVFYVQYYRPKTYSDPDNCKFGNRANSVYVRCGHQYILNGQEGNTVDNQSISGDVYNQRTIVKNRVWIATASAGTGVPMEGYGSGMAFFSQNIVNSELRYIDSQNTTQLIYPYSTTDTGIWLENTQQDQRFYDSGYDWFSIKQNNAVDPSLPSPKRLPTRVIYSNLKPQNSFTDQYRVFPPLQFKDLDPQYGEITHIANINTELFVWQPRNWQREYFNTTGLLSTNDGDLAVLGNAGVLSRPGVRISQYGTNNKWSVIIGRSRGGSDTVYWMNQEYGSVLRYGADGVNVISSLWLMNGFFQEYLRWAIRDTPADGQGICGVWNDRYQEVRYSVRGWKDTLDWVASTPYTAGSTVIDGYDIQEIPKIYRAKNSITSGVRPSLDPANWESIALSNSAYYSVFSIVISEVKNGFTTFLTPKPMIYMPWRKKFLTPNPDTDFSNLAYEENIGGYCEWYDTGTQKLSEDGYIESVINIAPQDIKTFIALMSVSEIAPARVDFSIVSKDSAGLTLNLNSYLLRNDFEWRESEWVSPIKNDTNTAPNGTPEEDTTQLYGAYINVKLWLKAGEFQRLTSYLVKYQFNARYLQT